MLRSRTTRLGFTVIELLMVLTLVAIVSGIVVTRVSFWSYRMDANARLIQNAMISAQQTAIQKNVTVFVMFDATEQRVRILQEYTNNNGVMDETDTVRYRPLADGARFAVPPTTIDGATAAYLTGVGVISTVNPLQRTLRISPNGSLSGDAVVYLASPRALAEDFRAVSIIGATGRTTFWSRAAGAWRRRDG